MKIIYVKLLFIMLFVLICISIVDKPKINVETKEYIVSVDVGNEIIEVELEDYLVGVIAGEMSASFEMEALKAQVVASRTFVLSRQLKVDNTVATQVYLNDEQMKEKWKNDYEK